MQILLDDKISWIPQTNCPGLVVDSLKFHGELIGEAYAPVSESNLPGVRVDKLYVLSASPDLERPSTRQHIDALRTLIKEFEELPPKFRVKNYNEYLPRDQIWTLGQCAEISWSSQKDRCKALLPVEMKVMGSLNLAIFEFIEEHSIHLGGTSRTTVERLLLDNPPHPSFNVSAVLGTLSIIRQALRYGPWYGVDKVIVTDYLCGVLIHVPPGLDRATKPGYRPVPQQVQWCYIEGKDLRITIGAVLWNVCQTVSQTLQEASGK